MRVLFFTAAAIAAFIAPITKGIRIENYMPGFETYEFGQLNAFQD